MNSISLSDSNPEEYMAQEKAKDWLSPATVYDHLRETLCMVKDMALLDIAPARLPVRLYPGDGVVCVVDPAILLRVAEHVGYGFTILCGAKSDDLLSNGLSCPICSSFLASQAMFLRFRWLIPCQIHAATHGEDWRWFKNAEFSGLKWLDIDHSLLRKLIDCGVLDEGLRLERKIDWNWIIERDPRIRRWSEHDLSRLRRDLPPPGIRLPTEAKMAEATKVAEANCHHSPEPGQTAKVLGWLPKGAVLVPCHFASKKPRVYWKALWSEREFTGYGAERADKGNLAVKMGTADIRTFDWDSDETFREFVRLNDWAQKAQQTFGARGGNVWCRMMLPSSLEHCWVLERAAGQGKAEKVGEFRAGNCLTTVCGAHPSGARYRIRNPGSLPLVTAEDVCWPEGVRLHKEPVRKASVYDDTPGEIRLDLSKIEGLHDHPTDPGSLEGRCPVCKREGKDTSCDNLKIWPSGAFHCIRDCDTGEIFSLVGRRRGWRGKSKNGIARGGATGGSSHDH